MAYASCPIAVVDAPVETVWALLTHPAGWDDVFDVRILSVEPPGPAAIGQTVLARSGPRLLRLKVEFRFTKIDPVRHELGLDVRLPFGVAVREDLSCVPLAADTCRLSYHCNFGFPAGWRGAVMRLLLRRELDAGPADSLSRLKRAAERRHADAAG